MRAYLYVLNTLADWEIGYVTAELNSGRFLDRTKKATSLIKIGDTAEPIKTMGGMSIAPDEIVDNVRFGEGDLLILPGAETWMDEGRAKILGIVSEIIGSKVVIAAICGATIALARKGLLNGRKHTSNDLDFLKTVCPEYSGGDFYINAPAVADDNLITASGIAPLEFAREIFKKTEVMKPKTIGAWYNLFKTQEAKYFHQLLDSLK